MEHQDTLNTEKKRLYTWSRRYRGIKRQSEPFTPEDMEKLKNVLEGESYLCFDKEGDWFRGSMFSHHRCLKFMGVRVSETNDVESSSGSHTPESDQLSGESSFSSEDSEISEMLNKIELKLAISSVEELDNMVEFNLTFAEYNIKVVDQETGLEYVVHNVRTVRRNSDTLIALSDNFQYKSKQVFKGVQADKILNKQFGPSMVDKSLLVYRGNLRFVYYDKRCCPVEVADTKWCL